MSYPRSEVFFASPGDPTASIPAKVKLHQRDILFTILAVAAVRSVTEEDVDRALIALNTVEGKPLDMNHLLAAEVKRVLATLKEQFGAQRQEAQEAVHATH